MTEADEKKLKQIRQWIQYHSYGHNKDKIKFLLSQIDKLKAENAELMAYIEEFERSNDE